MSNGTGPLLLLAPDGIGEIAPGDDLAAALLAAFTGECALADGDVLVVTSKVVAKAEGRVRAGDRGEALAEETRRVVAVRGATSIVRNRLGLTMAAAGIDASNVAAGSIVLLPEDPDASARRLRARVLAEAGVNVAVVVTDTAGRAWRDGQTDIAIGAAGLRVAESFAGRTDAYGNELAVTLPAVADEIAGAAELAQGKLGARPASLLRGRPDLVLPAGVDGPGAASLIRPEGADLFGYGAREAVLQALRGSAEAQLPFGAPVPADELATAVERLTGGSVTPGADPGQDPWLVRVAPDASTAGRSDRTALTALCFAHGWTLTGWTAEPFDGPPAPRVDIRLNLLPVVP